MKKLTLALSILAASHAVFATDIAVKMAGNAAAGKEKSVTCAACHGADGNSLVPIFPKLAGQHPDYIVNQLKLFKSKTRIDPSMQPMVEPLTEQDMANLAAHFSRQKLTLGAPSDNKVGKKIYHGGDLAKNLMACAACHGEKGMGNPAANYPQIQSQQAAYVVKQLKAFRDGSRTGSPSTQIMQDITSKMNDTEMEAVAAYISGLGH
jgi:cytochrome c553